MASRIPDTQTLPDVAATRLRQNVDGNQLEVIADGPALRDALIALISGAERTLRLQYYIFADDRSGRRVMAALVRAARRGVAVTLVVDAFGSGDVPPGFFALLRQAGGTMAWFGAGWSTRYLIRNHQKMAIADERQAMIGGFNVSDPYFGVPEDNCWHDLGLIIAGEDVAHLVRWYDALWQWLDNENRDYGSLRDMVRHWHDDRSPIRWLIGGPTHRLSPWARSVRADLEQARRIDMVSAYFAPGEGLLRRLRRVGRRGVARLILASKSDNTATVAASRLLYGPLLRAGVQIYEYQPCRLHMKLIVIDNAVYIGSANFDMRSLFINLELMLRIEDSAFADAIRAFIDERAADSRLITQQVHEARRTPLRLLKGWISYLLVAVLDYTVTRRLNFRNAGRD